MTTTDPRPLVVVPCYNEAARLDLTRFAALAESGRVRLLFVDDGSTDGTGAAPRPARADLAGVGVMRLPHNVGKAEAIRRGLLEASGRARAPWATSTPISQRRRGSCSGCSNCWRDGPISSFVLASRVALLGRRIRGALVATTSAVSLRPSHRSFSAFPSTTPNAAPRSSARHRRSRRRSRHRFGRRGSSTSSSSGGSSGLEHRRPVPLEEFEEMPLREWRDVSGSRLGLGGMARAAVDLAVVGYRLNRPRRAASGKD